MKFEVTLTFDDNMAEWAFDTGITEAEAPADFRDALNRNAPEIPASVAAVWRALDGIVTVTASTPRKV